MAKRMTDTNSWVRTFEVTEPTKHRKGFTVYKVTSVVFPRAFPESATKITVWKRYSDFRKLHKELEQIFKQLYLKGEFPLFPKAKVFGRFEHEVVEERRKAALILLEFTAKYTQLFTSKAFMHFFENGYNTQDFIGKILFRKDDGNEQDPPSTVLEEKSEIPTPCLKPQVLWNENECPTTEGDTVSLSPSSISSSISPESSEPPLVVASSSSDPEPNPCALVPTTNRLVKDKMNSENGTENSSSATPIPASNVIASSSSANVELVSSSKPKMSGAMLRTSRDTDTSTCDASSTRNQRLNGLVRSATVTDELSSYYDVEFEEAAFLFPVGSCSSLNTLPGFTPSSTDDVVDSAQKNVPSSSRGGFFTLSRKKSSGFGLFDFLPLFPKKSKKKKSVSQEKEDIKPVEPVETIQKTSLSVGYICEAAGHFAVAQFHESNTDYENAFNAYKEGIRVLLAGAQDDTDRERKVLARNKLEKYLSRAESLKESFLIPGTSNCGTVSPVFSSPSKKEKSLSFLADNGKGLNSKNGRSFMCSIEELKPYKVVGIGPRRSKILVVMNPDEPSPKCYATKVLWKSPCVIHPDKPTVIPCHIPFMVKLLKWFDTPDKIILLLEYAGGGRLEEFVKNYQSKRLSLSTSTEEHSPDDDKKTSTLESTIEPEVVVVNPTVNNAPDNYALETVANPPAENITAEQDHVAEPTPTITVGENEVLSDNEVFCTPAVSPPLNEDYSSDPEQADVRRLLENSKALLQTVSKTLEEGNSPKKVCDSKYEEVTAKEVNSDIQQVLDAPVAQNQSIGQRSSQQSSRKNSDAIEEFDSNYVPLRMVPEGVVKVWAAEIAIALEALHNIGITYGDLQIRDILLGENGHILLRYKSLWTEIDDKLDWNFYTAPEVRDSIGTPLWKIHPSADWWSLGSILFLLLTGQTLDTAHPEGIYPEMIIKVPNVSVCDTPISKSAQSLLKELLQYSAELRLGYYGAPEIKTHPFFDGYDWDKAIDECRNNEEDDILQTTSSTN